MPIDDTQATGIAFNLLQATAVQFVDIIGPEALGQILFDMSGQCHTLSMIGRADAALAVASNDL